MISFSVLLAFGLAFLFFWGLSSAAFFLSEVSRPLSVSFHLSQAFSRAFAQSLNFFPRIAAPSRLHSPPYLIFGADCAASYVVTDAMQQTSLLSVFYIICCFCCWCVSALAQSVYDMLLAPPFLLKANAFRFSSWNCLNFMTCHCSCLNFNANDYQESEQRRCMKLYQKGLQFLWFSGCFLSRNLRKYCTLKIHY